MEEDVWRSNAQETVDRNLKPIKVVKTWTDVGHIEHRLALDRTETREPRGAIYDRWLIRVNGLGNQCICNDR